MQKQYPHPIIAREGWPFLTGTLVASFVFFQFDWTRWLGWVALILFFFCLQFFRDPARRLPVEADVMVSPVDGRVCKIQDAVDPITGKEAIMVSIFMNVFNVHSQKSPVSGVVEEIRYTPGLFLNADLDKASTKNERNAVQVRLDDGRQMTFVQVAGLVARRILCYAKVGDRLERGQRYGFIRFGSRVDVYMPKNSHILVAIGEKVTGVSTPIARIVPEVDTEEKTATR